ncbi:unnamed protein product [Euphydryas editha]|uniref:Uncharacterized protein n=1 Tax=Euphydryas editha TaxID=104508 RepID=A0AAU9UAU9_EUPED|nr:unnamed protein product [Euphydryas editha]
MFIRQHPRPLPPALAITPASSSGVTESSNAAIRRSAHFFGLATAIPSPKISLMRRTSASAFSLPSAPGNSSLRAPVWDLIASLHAHPHYNAIGLYEDLCVCPCTARQQRQLRRH